MRIQALQTSMAVWLLAAATSWGETALIQVEATARPEAGWKKYSTRTVAHMPELAALPADSCLDTYGGWLAQKQRGRGFFYTTNMAGRWWLVDPEGGLFLHKGVNAVSPLQSPGANASFAAKYGTGTNWAREVTSLLRQSGFNGVGGWSNVKDLRAIPAPLAYTCSWDFMSAYGRKRGGMRWEPGHAGYPGDCIFVFDPEFETFCDQYAQQLTATKDDPWLLGHFSDNELPFSSSALSNYLALPENEPGRQAAIKWLRERHGAGATERDISTRDSKDFLEGVVSRYFRIVSAAIHKYDPNHLLLGSRLYGSSLYCPEVFRAAGPYIDVVSVNYYGAWTPDAALLRRWSEDSGRPVMITEWYAKGEDSGMSNRSGAGWIVRTQRDRGLFYQNFVLGLLSSKVCVGWHWFRYADNDPSESQADPSNRDSNKGIVSNRYEPYQPLLDAMRQVNERAYATAGFFERPISP